MRRTSASNVALTAWKDDIGKQRKPLNGKPKAPFEAKAAADKKHYEEEKAAYSVVSFLSMPLCFDDRIDPTKRSRCR